jgi:7-carboxy-7-deazaguanine synthase
MTYSVKEIFLTLQGEGAQTGRRAVFCRLSGCNLWSGREADREFAVCRFCDTDFVGTDGDGGGKFDQADALADAIQRCWGPGLEHRMVVLTGGEPLLQVDVALIEALHARRFLVAVESNGSVVAPVGIDWLCISPKAGAPWVQRSGQELKVVHPQPGLDPGLLEVRIRAGELRFEHHFLQPMDGPQRQAHLEKALQACLDHPRWRLGLQTHKITGIR